MIVLHYSSQRYSFLCGVCEAEGCVDARVHGVVCGWLACNFGRNSPFLVVFSKILKKNPKQFPPPKKLKIGQL